MVQRTSGTQSTQGAQSIPEEAYRLGETYQLGVPTAAYRVAYTQADLLFFWTQVTIVSLMLLVAIGLIVAVALFHIHIDPLLLIPLFFFLGALNIANTSRATRRRGKLAVDPALRNLRVYMYPEGFIRLRNKKLNKTANRTLDVVRWDEIRRVRSIGLKGGYKGNFQPSITVVRKDGRTLSLGAELPGIEELSAIIEQEYQGHA